MKKLPWRLILRIIAISVVLASIVWLIVQPGFEPLIGFLTAIGALIASLVDHVFDVRQGLGQTHLL
jgi:hypothetical protein